jgi:hypothetical protein
VNGAASIGAGASRPLSLEPLRALAHHDDQARVSEDEGVALAPSQVVGAEPEVAPQEVGERTRVGSAASRPLRPHWFHRCHPTRLGHNSRGQSRRWSR